MNLASLSPEFGALPFMPSHVTKRHGTRQAFSADKLKNAIGKAVADVHGPPTALEEDARTLQQDLVEAVTRVAIMRLEDCPQELHVDHVEYAVVEALNALGQKAVAVAYEEWRSHRAELRAKRKAMPAKALEDYIHVSKYARYRPADQRRETREETVDRMMAMHIRRFPHLKERIELVGQRIKDKHLLGSMRAMQFGGEAVEKVNNRMFNCTAAHIDSPRRFAEAFHWLLSGSGVGYSVQSRHVRQLPVLAPAESFAKSSPILFTPEDNIEGWAKCVEHLVTCYIAGIPPAFDLHKIRRKGTLMKTSGGRAPGPMPLRIALNRVEIVLDGAVGRQLTPFECHTILCHLADAVRAGGTRRSAMIALFDADDTEMLACKASSNWYEHSPWLARANNSAVLHREHATFDDLQRVIAHTKAWGDPGFFWVSDYDTLCNPCGEVGLYPVVIVDETNINALRAKGLEVKLGERLTGWQGCNLTSVNMATCETAEEFWSRCEDAAFLGTLQAAYTSFPYTGPVSEYLFEREALIGVSMTGMQDNPELAFDPKVLREGARRVLAVNAETAKAEGINPAARNCTLKPEGTGSLWLGGVASGIHPHHDRLYFRRVEADQSDPLYQYVKSINPEMTYDIPNSNKAVIIFCIEAPEDAVLRKDKGAVEFLGDVRVVMENWIIPGGREDQAAPEGVTHNVSNTVSVRGPEHFKTPLDERVKALMDLEQAVQRLRELDGTAEVDASVYTTESPGEPVESLEQQRRRDGEWPEVAAFIWEHRRTLNGIALMGFWGDHKHPYAPRQSLLDEVDEAQWNRICENYTPIDYTQFTETEDLTDLQGEIACGAMGCDV